MTALDPLSQHLPLEREPGAPPPMRPQCIAEDWHAPYPWDHEPPAAGIIRAWWNPVDRKLLHAGIGHLRYACFSTNASIAYGTHLDDIRHLFAGPGEWSWHVFHNLTRVIDGRPQVADSWVLAPFVSTDRPRAGKFS